MLNTTFVISSSKHANAFESNEPENCWVPKLLLETFGKVPFYLIMSEPVTTRVISVVIVIPAVLAVIALIVALFIPCSYLAVRAVVIVIAGLSPLVDVSVRPVIFG
jgi:hypothetical protein